MIQQLRCQSSQQTFDHNMIPWPGKVHERSYDESFKYVKV